MDKIIQRIKYILEDIIGLETPSEELAYLGLTSGIEHYFRDKIAVDLHSFFRDKYIVSREWNKCDLAILDPETLKPLLLIEFKYCLSFDLTIDGKLREFTNKIKKDITKSKAISEPNAEIYSIVFIAIPKQPIDKIYKPIIKYINDINRAFKRYDDDADLIKEVAEGNLEEVFENIEFGHIRNDNTFGINIGFGYGIIKVENDR